MQEKQTVKKKKEKPLTQTDILKLEIAEELGLLDKVRDNGWKALTSRESGKIGGIMSKRKRQEEVKEKKNEFGERTEI